MSFDGKQMQQEFDDAFSLTRTDNQKLEGITFDNITPRQLWWLVKFAKHVRLRCRNNSAFNNYLNRNFSNATFKEVTKHKKDGTSYQGLSITVNGQEVSDNLED
jgi:hypothetical protein